MIDPKQLESDKGKLQNQITDLVLEFEKKYPIISVESLNAVHAPGYGSSHERLLGFEVKITLK